MPTPRMSSVKNENREAMLWKVSLFILIIIAAALLSVAHTLYRGGTASRSAVQQRAAAYQAVFLSNGQVYFGRMTNEQGSSITLIDVYYLRTQQQLQEPKEGDDVAPAQPDGPQLTLVKLGDELHGPMDRMEINRDHVLYVEDLRDDGQVVETIMKHKTSAQ